ncbi:MAG: outer-membrane lipoprotein carrier protein LolA [Sumerlaeia bacterium]
MTTSLKHIAAAFALSLALFAGGAAWAQESAPATPAAATTPKVVTPQELREQAETFLRKIEEKNKDVTTLHGVFEQTRINTMFLDEIHSNGEFWYKKPSKFRCDYYEPTRMSFYMLGNDLTTYTPELKQVEKYTLESGDGAPINQMLVGFGVQTERILELFDVKLAPIQPAEENLLIVDFVSRDLDRTLGYSKITITFDTAELEPMVLVLEEEEDVVTVNLKEVEFNADIPEDKFETKFPEGTEVVEY